MKHHVSGIMWLIWCSTADEKQKSDLQSDLSSFTCSLASLEARCLDCFFCSSAKMWDWRVRSCENGNTLNATEAFSGWQAHLLCPIMPYLCPSLPHPCSIAAPPLLHPCPTPAPSLPTPTSSLPHPCSTPAPPLPHPCSTPLPHSCFIPAPPLLHSLFGQFPPFLTFIDFFFF